MSALASALGSILVRFTADANPFSEGCKQAEDSVEHLVNKASSLGDTLIKAIPFAVIGAEAFEAGEKFEAAQFTIQRATGATGEKLEGLNASFKKLYATTTQSSEATAGALSQLSIRTGLVGEALEKLTTANLKFAKVTGTDVGQAGGTTYGNFSAPISKESPNPKE